MSRAMVFTPKKQRIYDFILKFKQENDGNSPSIREIADGVGISSTSVVNYHLAAMARLGIISRSEVHGGNRSIKITGGVWLAPQ